MKKLLTGLVAAFILLCASIATNVVLLTRDTAPVEEEKDTPVLTIDTDDSEFQAVFLTNGQVYFGKLSLENETTYKLTNVYYLQEDGVSLSKLGSEPHKPKDVMYIERAQVSFWENLKNLKQFDGKLK